MMCSGDGERVDKIGEGGKETISRVKVK